MLRQISLLEEKPRLHEKFLELETLFEDEKQKWATMAESELILVLGEPTIFTMYDLSKSYLFATSFAVLSALALNATLRSFVGRTFTRIKSAQQAEEEEGSRSKRLTFTPE